MQNELAMYYIQHFFPILFKIFVIAFLLLRSPHAFNPTYYIVIQLDLVRTKVFEIQLICIYK